MNKAVIAGLATGLFMLGMADGASAIPINAAQGATVTLNGTFFTGGWGGGQTVAAETVVDGLFLPKDNQWDQGALWWDNTQGEPYTITLDLGAIFNIESFVVQADDNDAYVLQYWDQGASSWVTAWDVPNSDGTGWGMQTRPNPFDNTLRYMLPATITTNALRFYGNPASGDNLFAVSEIQAYGSVPEPAAMILFGTGLLGLVGSVLRRKK